MTNIELETLTMAKAAFKKYIAEEINWEQRRYEIAKDVLCGMIAAGKSGDVRDAVQAADALITALKDK